MQQNPHRNLRTRTWRRILAALGVLCAGALAITLISSCRLGLHSFTTPSTLPTSRIARPADGELMAGKWRGTWQSTSNSMSGALEATIRKRGENAYDALFKAQVAGPLSMDQDVTFIVSRNGDVWTFSGEKDLGLLNGGVYKYNGSVDGAQFKSTYDSSFDTGTFEMVRVAEPATQTRPADP